MSLRFKTNLLEHAKAFSTWATAHQARAYIDVKTMALAVQRGAHGVEFAAQYVGHQADGSLAYYRDMGPHCIGFVGWLPYPVQQWSLSKSKLEFKDVAASLGVRTPDWWRDREAVDQTYILKADRSAFGYGIRGPYLAADRSRDALAWRPDEYADAFKTGRIARAWYWADQLAVLEMFPMPKVVGNGRSRFVDLLQAQLGANEALPTFMAQIAHVQGFELDSVVPVGRSLIADFRYVSPFNPTLYANNNLLSSLARGGTSPLVQSFVHAGRALWSRIPGAAQRPMAFVLDAIVDDADTAWFLEVNCNAQLHPDLYPFMLTSLFAAQQPNPYKTA
jgi:hypothetical protein